MQPADPGAGRALKKAQLLQPSDSVFVTPASSVLPKEENNPRPPNSGAGTLRALSTNPCDSWGQSLESTNRSDMEDLNAISEQDVVDYTLETTP